MNGPRTTGWPDDVVHSRKSSGVITGLGWPEPGGRREAPRRVVVGIDGSPGSLATLRRAVAQARRRHAGLEIVHAIPENASAGAEAEARDMLRRIVAREYPEGLTVPVRRRVERGEPARVLARASVGAELLVVCGESRPGNHGMSGDVLRRILRIASCPVDTCADGPDQP